MSTRHPARLRHVSFAPRSLVLASAGLTALASLGCDDDPPVAQPTATPNKIFCQIHTATCRVPVQPASGDSTCSEVWLLNGNPAFSFFYKWDLLDPQDQFNRVPQAAYPYLDGPTGSSYAPQADVVTEANRTEFGPGEYACAVPGKTPDEVCAELCGTNRQGATEADGRTRAAAHPPLTAGGQPYCVGFPVKGPSGTTMEGGMCHGSMRTQSLLSLPGHPQSADLHAGMQGLGSGTNVRIGDAGANIPVIGGHVALKLPDASCRNAPCQGRISSLELRYGNMIYSVGDRDFAINELTLDLADPLDVVVRPVSGTSSYRVDIPSGTLMHAAARRDGLPQTLAVRTPDLGNITYDPVTGDVSVDISWSSNFGGNTISGNVFATQYAVYGRPLDVQAGTDVSADATDATCAASVSVIGSAADPDGHLIAQGWNLGTTILSDGPSASTTLPIGDHTLTFQALKSNGGVGFDNVGVHVLDKTLPQFVEPDATLTLHGCSPSQTTFHLPIPEARDLCSPDLPGVTGIVTEVNGSPASIVIASDGAVALPAGVHHVVWTATNMNGPVELDQEVRVISEPTLYASRSLTVGSGADITAGDTLFGTLMNTFDGHHHRHRHHGFGWGSWLSGWGRPSGGFTLVGDKANVGDVLSSPFLDLRTGSHVHGSIVHSDGLRQGRNSVVDGGIAELDDFPGPDVPWEPPAFDGGPSFSVRDGETITVAPGSYRSLRVRRGGTVVLANGAYAWKEIEIDESGTLVVPDLTAGVALYVQRELDYHGSAETAGGAAAPIFLGYAGDDGVTLDNSFWGVVVARSSRVVLDDGVRDHHLQRHCFKRGHHHGHEQEEPATYRGRFYARDLEVVPKLDVDHDTLLCTADP